MGFKDTYVTIKHNITITRSIHFLLPGPSIVSLCVLPLASSRENCVNWLRGLQGQMDVLCLLGCKERIPLSSPYP